MPSVLHVHFHVCGEHELTQALTYINKDKQIFKELTVTKSMLIKVMSCMGTRVRTTKEAGPCLCSASFSYPLNFASLFTSKTAQLDAIEKSGKVTSSGVPAPLLHIS